MYRVQSVSHVYSYLPACLPGFEGRDPDAPSCRARHLHRALLSLQRLRRCAILLLAAFVGVACTWRARSTAQNWLHASEQGLALCGNAHAQSAT